MAKKRRNSEPVVLAQKQLGKGTNTKSINQTLGLYRYRFLNSIPC